MRICQLCAVDFTMYHFLLPLIQGMAAAGHEVVGVCSDGPLVKQVRAAGVRIETVPIARSYDLRQHFKSYRDLVALFGRETFDMIHVHTPVAALIGRAAAWRAGVGKIVYTAHGFYFHDRMAWPKRLFFIALEWLAGQCTDVLLTQAEEDAATARRWHLCRGGVIVAIGNGANPARFVPDTKVRARLRAKFGIADDRPVVLVIGRLVAEKGYLELFEAMKSVDAELWVVGERLTSDHASAIDRAMALVTANSDLSRRIRFLGYRQDVPDLLRAADVFVLPSHREGMPRSIIEAMLASLPVVATDIRGAREEVVNSETGILVPVGNASALAEALTTLTVDPSLRARMGAAGRARARDLYDEEKVVGRQLAILGLTP